jgi:hypothetical protein
MIHTPDPCSQNLIPPPPPSCPRVVHAMGKIPLLLHRHASGIKILVRPKPLPHTTNHVRTKIMASLISPLHYVVIKENGYFISVCSASPSLKKDHNRFKKMEYPRKVKTPMNFITVQSEIVKNFVSLFQFFLCFIYKKDALINSSLLRMTDTIF